MSRSPEEISTPAHSGITDSEYNSEERALLLALAHQSILTAFEGKQPELPSVSARLAEPRGAFTTLYLDGELHGCVGYVQPVAPLYQTIIMTARAAAFKDTRFPPITPDEARKLEVSLSILSLLSKARPEEVEVGRHGLVVSAGERRGLLLPQVAVEHQWDRETFLAQTCRKAGLPPEAWRRGATIQVFTAELFGDGPRL